MTLLSLATLFAENAPAGGEGGGGPGMGDFLRSFGPMILVFAAFWYFILYLPMKRERSRQAAMLAGLKKNDQVRTASGMYGVITNIAKEANDIVVTLRIDESTNAKMRVSVTSIAQVLGGEPATDAPSK